MTNLQKHGEAGVLFRNRWTATSWAHTIWQVWGKFRGPCAFLIPSISENANPVITHVGPTTEPARPWLA